MSETETKIISLIDKIRPYLVSDGGNLEFVKFEDGIAYIKFMGACADCGLQNVTLNDGIKEFLVNEIDEVIDVKLI